jgi:hypothetical protein
VNVVLLHDERMSEAIYNENTEEEFFILNIEAIDERGYRYDVKIEVAYKSFSFVRLLYYWVKFCVKGSEESNEIEENNESEENNECEKNNECELIRKTIVIFILNWSLFEEVKTYHNALQLRNKQDENFEVHFIELERQQKYERIRE